METAALTLEKIVILDVETTGLDPEEHKVIEIALVGYVIPLAAVAWSCATIVDAGSENPAELVNHIPGTLLAYGQPPKSVWDSLWCEQAGFRTRPDAILAHNADFDKQWCPDFLLHFPWVDTCHAVTWPKSPRPGCNLIELALAHGLAVVDPHRALSDCLLLARLLTDLAGRGHDIAALLRQGLREQLLFQALVSYADRKQAYENGFHWEAAQKRWVRKMAEEDTKSLPFRVIRVAP